MVVTILHTLRDVWPWLHCKDCWSDVKFKMNVIYLTKKYFYTFNHDHVQNQILKIYFWSIFSNICSSSKKNSVCSEKLCQNNFHKNVSALVEWLEYPTLVGDGLGVIPARVKLYYECSMDVMIIPPVTCLTLNESVKSWRLNVKQQKMSVAPGQFFFVSALKITSNRFIVFYIRPSYFLQSI